MIRILPPAAARTAGFRTVFSGWPTLTTFSMLPQKSARAHPAGKAPMKKR
jgi:hypothetical protein